MREIDATHWEGRTAEELANAWGAPRVYLFEELGSTNDVARALALEGAPAGTVVLAELQTAGRGRAGRRWESPAGAGLWLSILARSATTEQMGPIPIGIGLVTAACLDDWTAGRPVGIKWPNDLIADGRKLGGILCEGSWSGGAATIVAGIGINVRPLPSGLPEEIQSRSTALDTLRGARADRSALADGLVAAVLRRIALPFELTEGEMAALEARDVLRGREVRVTEPVGGALLAVGTQLGVDAAGALLLRDAAGALRRIHSGTVRAV